MRFLTSVKGLAAVAVLVAGAYAIPSATAAETMGPVTDEIGVVKIAKGQPMVWGGSWVLSGPDTALGLKGEERVWDHGRRGADGCALNAPGDVPLIRGFHQPHVAIIETDRARPARFGTGGGEGLVPGRKLD